MVLAIKKRKKKFKQSSSVTVPHAQIAVYNKLERKKEIKFMFILFIQMIQILEIKEKAMNWEYYGSLLLRILLTL